MIGAVFIYHLCKLVFLYDCKCPLVSPFKFTYFPRRRSDVAGNRCGRRFAASAARNFCKLKNSK
jgi:hypothetical protein